MRHCWAIGLFLAGLTVGQAAEPKPFASATDSSSKTHIGPIVEDTPTEIAIQDLKEGIEFRAPKTSLKKFEKSISDDAAVRTVGLSAVVAYRVSEWASASVTPVGKIAQVTQNVVYLNLGEKSGLHVGQKLTVYRKVSEIRDPDTKEVIAIERPKMGTLEVTEVQKAFSKGRVVSDVEITLKPGDEVEPEGGGVKVAVLPLKAESGEQFDISQNLAEEIVTELVQQKVTVIERTLLDRVVAEQVWQNTILFEPDKVQRLGQLTGATAVVTGKLVVKGKLGTVFIRLIDVRSAKILYATSGSVSLANAKATGSTEKVDTAPVAGGSKATTGGELGRKKTLPEGWTTQGRFLVEKDGGIRLSNKADLIITRDVAYSKKDFVFEVVVTLRDDDHIAFVGMGDPTEVNGYGEPKNVAMLRIHAPHLKSGVLLTKSNSTTDNLGMINRPGTHLIRIAKEGTSVTFRVDVDNDGETPDDMELTIVDIQAYAPFLHAKNTCLFFGGSGTFKSVTVK